MNYFAAYRWFRQHYGQTLADGDIVYIGSGGLLRLALGTPGYVLTAKATTPWLEWAAAGGTSGGTSDHTALSNLSWTASGHTATASRFAYFGSGGAAELVATDAATIEVAASTLRVKDAGITSAKLRDSAALSVIGRSANSTGVPGDIAATPATDAVLRESGSVLGFGTVATAGLANNAVTDAKLRDGGARSVIGRAANSSGDPADISGAGANTVLTDDGSTLAFTTFAALVLAGLFTAVLDPGYGDGTDGSTTYSANQTISEELNATDINIDASVTVIAPYPMRARGTLSFDATSSVIHNSGVDAVGSGAAGGAQGYGSGYAGAAGANGRVTTNNGIAGSSRTSSVVPMIGTSTSGNGGAGGASSGNTLGAGGTCTQINTTSGRGHSRPVIEYCVPPTGSSGMFGGAGGGGGALTLGAGTGASGNGGGGGGVVIVWAHTIDCTTAVGVIRAKGGNGSNSTAAGGASGGGGGGGGGGLAIMVYAKLVSGISPTHTAGKGTGGTGSGAGGINGSDGVDGVAWAVVVP